MLVKNASKINQVRFFGKKVSKCDFDNEEYNGADY